MSQLARFFPPCSEANPSAVWSKRPDGIEGEDLGSSSMASSKQCSLSRYVAFLECVQ